MLNFNEKFPAYALGRRVDSQEWNTFSRSLVGSTAVGFGAPVTASGNDGFAPLTAAAQVVLGITEADQTLPHPDDEYRQYETAGICEIGCIGVLLGADVTVNSQARWNVTDKAWTGATASATVLTIPGATFERSGKSGEIGVVRYRRTNPSVATGA